MFLAPFPLPVIQGERFTGFVRHYRKPFRNEPSNILAGSFIGVGLKGIFEIDDQASFTSAIDFLNQREPPLVPWDLRSRRHPRQTTIAIGTPAYVVKVGVWHDTSILKGGGYFNHFVTQLQ